MGHVQALERSVELDQIVGYGIGCRIVVGDGWRCRRSVAIDCDGAFGATAEHENDGGYRQDEIKGMRFHIVSIGLYEIVLNCMDRCKTCAVRGRQLQ